MEFGTLVPQGWRYDLMGVQGAAAKWNTFERVEPRPRRRRAADSRGCRDHFHTFPKSRSKRRSRRGRGSATLARSPTRPIGQIVACVQYQQPAYLAKISSCVDVASGGRLNVGLGSGWFEEEFQAFGYDLRTVGARLRRSRGDDPDPRPHVVRAARELRGQALPDRRRDQRAEAAAETTTGADRWPRQEGAAAHRRQVRRRLELQRLARRLRRGARGTQGTL